MKTLFVSDLDGTLLTPQASLSPFAKDILQQLLQNDVSFTIATSRSMDSVKAILGNLKLSLPVIQLNGAYITDLETGKHLAINHLPSTCAQDIFEQVIALNLRPLISAYQGLHFTYHTGISNAGLQWCLADHQARSGRPWQYIAPFSHLPQNDIVRFTVIDRYDALKALDEILQQQYGGALETHFFENPYQPDWYWLTIQDYRANKGNGIRTIQSAYGLEEHTLTVFGDHNNDISMFKVADTALATENATEQLKQHATGIIGHHHEDSVVKYLQTMGLSVKGKPRIANISPPYKDSIR